MGNRLVLYSCGLALAASVGVARADRVKLFGAIDADLPGWSTPPGQSSTVLQLTNRPVFVTMSIVKETCPAMNTALSMTPVPRPTWAPAWLDAPVGHSRDGEIDDYGLCTDIGEQRLIVVVAVKHPTSADESAISTMFDGVHRAFSSAAAADKPAAPVAPPPPPPPPPPAATSITLLVTHKVLTIAGTDHWNVDKATSSDGDHDIISRATVPALTMEISPPGGETSRNSKQCSNMTAIFEAKNVGTAVAPGELLPPGWSPNLRLTKAATADAPDNILFACVDEPGGPLIVLVAYRGSLSDPDLRAVRPALQALGIAFGGGSSPAPAVAATPAPTPAPVSVSSSDPMPSPPAAPPPADVPPPAEEPTHHRHIFGYKATVAFVRSTPAMISDASPEGNGIAIATGQERHLSSFVEYEWRLGGGYDTTAGGSLDMRAGLGLSLHGGPLNIALLGGIGGDGIGLSRDATSMKGLQVPFEASLYGRAVAYLYLAGTTALEVAVQEDDRKSGPDGLRYEAGLVFYRPSTTLTLMAFDHEYGDLGKLVGGGLGFTY